MGQKEKIAIREASLGPVIARADHVDGAIEVNKDYFYRLPSAVQEYVLCHEVCHLKHDEWDEGKTNALASQLYLSRAKNEADRRERKQFLSFLSDNGGYTNFAFWSVIPAAVSLGYSVYGVILDQEAGWYSWDVNTKKKNLKTMLTQAFEQARRSNKHSASEYFWTQLYNYDNKDVDVDKFLKRSENAWVKSHIAKYEKYYGFGFDEVTPIDLKAFPLVMLAIGLAVGFVVYKIIKKVRK